MKKYFSIVISFLLGIVIIGSFNSCNNEKNELTEVSARLKWFGYAASMGTYAADDWGFFNENGLDVKIYQGGPSVDATKLVAGGDNQFGICGGDQFIVAKSKGLPLVAIAALYQSSPAGFMVLESSDIYGMDDFPGHVIRIIPGHNTEIEYRAVMSKLGIDKEPIEEMVNLTQLLLLLSGQIDIEPIYINNQPSLADFEGIKYRVYKPKDYGVNPYGNIYFTTEKLIEENPEIVQQFISAVLKGWEQSFDTPEQAIDSLIQRLPNLNKEVEFNKLALTKPLMEREDGKLGMMEAERWEEIEELLMEFGIIKNEFDVEGIFTNRFVENYYKDK